MPSQQTLRPIYYTWSSENFYSRIFIVYGQDSATRPTIQPASPFRFRLPLGLTLRPHHTAASRLSGPFTYALPPVNNCYILALHCP